jgi:hypothetical protein
MDPATSRSNSYNRLSRGDLVRLCLARGLITRTPRSKKSILSKQLLVLMLVEKDEDKHRYMKWKVKELKHFIRNRGLQATGKSKSDLEKVLEDDDSNHSLRFMDLPAELRVKVCSYADR